MFVFVLPGSSKFYSRDRQVYKLICHCVRQMSNSVSGLKAPCLVLLAEKDGVIVSKKIVEIIESRILETILK